MSAMMMDGKWGICYRVKRCLCGYCRQQLVSRAEGGGFADVLIELCIVYIVDLCCSPVRSKYLQCREKYKLRYK